MHASLPSPARRRNGREHASTGDDQAHVGAGSGREQVGAGSGRRHGSRNRVKPDPDPDQVARFLSDNPDWLAAQDGLYQRLSPPRRVHGEALADHMAAMLEATRRHAAAHAEQSAAMLRTLRAGSSLARQVEEAILALLRADDLGACIAIDLPSLLGIDAALLCIEGGHGTAALCALLQARTLPRGSVGALIGGRDVVLRAGPPDAAALHGEAALLARQDALLRVPVAGRPPMLLALAARDDAVLHQDLTDGGGIAALGFLGRAVAARIEAAGPECRG